jgi:hypothetical protein
VALFIHFVSRSCITGHLTAGSSFFRLNAAGLLLLVFAWPCSALDPDPRRWNHVPVGTNFAGAAYVYTEADIAFDPVLLLENVEMEKQSWAFAYVRAFELANKSARIDITQAYQKATWNGLLEGAPASTARSGWSDTFVRFAVNLYGAPPLSGKKYSDYRAKQTVETIVGAGLVVRLPTGQYMPDKLLNLGQNRFVFLPQLGVVHNRGKWSTELTGEVALYNDNDSFYNGKTLEQRPMYIVIGHIMRTFNPGQWLGVSFGAEYGGEKTVDGVDKDDRQHNVGWALTYSHPINRQTGIKLKYIGIKKKEFTGFDSNSLLLNGVFSW